MDRRAFLQYGGMAAASLLVAGSPVPSPTPLRSGSPGRALAQVLDGLPRGPRAGDWRLSASVALAPFTALAFTVPVGLDGIWARSRAADAWSPWTFLPVDTDHGPDRGEGRPAARGDGVVTELLWTSTAEAFQVAMPGDGPVERVRAHLVDTLGAVVEDVAGPVGGLVDDALGLLSDEPDEEEDRPRRPRIVRRHQWGADESWRRGRVAHARPRRAILHHTATSNGYSRAEVPGIVRAIYHYHARVRGWNDIGYNFLVDRFGRIFEGRAGGVGRGVVGAHARGHNTGSIGVSVIGNLQDVEPRRATLAAVADLLAWKYHRHGIPSRPSREVRHAGRSYPVLAGHRDVGRTACPGGNLYDRLPRLRRGIHRRS